MLSREVIVYMIAPTVYYSQLLLSEKCLYNKMLKWKLDFKQQFHLYLANIFSINRSSFTKFLITIINAQIMKFINCRKKITGYKKSCIILIFTKGHRFSIFKRLI